MNNFSADIMTIFFFLTCCLCTFLILAIAFMLYILGSARVRSALVTMSLIKTGVDLFKDFFTAFRTVKKSTSKTKTTANNATKPSPVYVDVDFREKNK